MKCYSKAPDECHDRVKHLINLFRPDLRDIGLKVDILSVANDDEDDDSPALMHQGYPAAAVIRVLDSKQRAKGMGDVEIIIDEAAYLTMPDASKDALLDHELHHVELRLNKKGRVKLDEHHRPKCGMRKHDYQFGWFTEIAKRHGAAALEVKQARTLFINEQAVFFFFVETVATPKQLVERIDNILSDREPSEKVKALAKEINESPPAVRAAAKNFVSTILAMSKKDGTSMSMTSGGKGVKIDADGVHAVD